MDAKTRNALFLQHVGLVRKVAYNYSKKCTVALEDLEQIGSIGLINALDKFNPERGYKLSTYAIPLIRGEILHYLRDKATIIKAPRSYSEIFQSVNRISLREGISLCAAAAIKNISPEKWQAIISAMSASSYVLGIDEKLASTLAIKSDEDDQDIVVLKLLDDLPELEKKALQGFYFNSMNGSALSNYLECDRATAMATVNDALLKIRDRVSAREEIFSKDARNVPIGTFRSASDIPPNQPDSGVYQLSVASFKNYSILKCCPKCGHDRIYNHGQTTLNKSRYKCCACKRTFISSIGQADYRRRVSDHQVNQIMTKRRLGESLRSITKGSELSHNTVAKLCAAVP